MGSCLWSTVTAVVCASLVTAVVGASAVYRSVLQIIKSQIKRYYIRMFLSDYNYTTTYW